VDDWRTRTCTNPVHMISVRIKRRGTNMSFYSYTYDFHTHKKSKRRLACVYDSYLYDCHTCINQNIFEYLKFEEKIYIFSILDLERLFG